MTRTLALTTALAAALALAACQDKKGEDTGAVENASAESGVGSNPASNTVQDAAGAAVGAAGAAVAGRTTGGYVTNAAMADMYEIMAAEIATEKSKNAEIKKLAAMIKKDHTKAASEMTEAVKSAGPDAKIPPALDERRQGMIDNLKQAPADGFDKVYLTQQEAAHEEALTLHRTYAEAGDVAGLKAHAAKNAPIVEGHLNMVKKLDEANAGAKPAQ